MGGVTSFIGSVRSQVAAYKYLVALPPFSLPPSVFSPLAVLALSPSFARTPPRAVANPPSFRPRCR